MGVFDLASATGPATEKVLREAGKLLMQPAPRVATVRKVNAELARLLPAIDSLAPLHEGPAGPPMISIAQGVIRWRPGAETQPPDGATAPSPAAALATVPPRPAPLPLGPHPE